jgi:serine/threonine protein kinase
MTLNTDLTATCERILGPVQVLADMSWPGNSNRVLELLDRDGRPWIAKQLGDDYGFQRELHALRHWAPALGDCAPSLRAADERHRLLVMSRLPGQRAEHIPAETEPATHEQAGRLTRLLHDAEPPCLDDGILAATVAKLEDWIGRGRRLLSEDEIAFARGQVRPLADFGPVPIVPTHMDNQPRNWLVDDAGVVRMIDFGACRRDVWIRDLQRMYFQQWEHRPDLRDAFYAGYGRVPGDGDLALLGGYLAYSGLSTVVWANEHGDPVFEQHGHRVLAQLQVGHWPAG